MRPHALAEAAAAGICRAAGDRAKLGEFLDMLDDFAPMFDTVTPGRR